MPAPSASTSFAGKAAFAIFADASDASTFFCALNRARAAFNTRSHTAGTFLSRPIAHSSNGPLIIFARAFDTAREPSNWSFAWLE